MQLFINKKLFISLQYVLSRSSCQFSNLSLFMQAFLFASYCTGLLLTFLKQRGFFDLPITMKGNFTDPTKFAPTKTVILSLLIIQYCICKLIP